MGQDGEDREGDDPEVRTEPGGRQPAVFKPQRPRPFRREVNAAIRYERGLVLKALLALAVVAVIVILRALYFG
jgi:hypothetical protein